MQRTLRNSTLRVFSAVACSSIAIATCVIFTACASKNNDSQWQGDDGGYGGTGRFNPVGSGDNSDNLNDNSGAQNY
ncbi:MAG: hypothetical protein KF805_05915 [Phycisphaeraceae bacterium]|nr:hypothetical protein [Phycisphaeraceae bacterium]